MPNGKPGDHPLTDIIIYGRRVYSERADALVREIVELGDVECPENRPFPRGTVMSDVVDIYAELGAYERHFNTIQGHQRALASTWLLATFGALGYVYTQEPNPFPVDVDLVACLISMAGATGIVLLWIVDVLVYFRLLLAVADEAESLERGHSAQLPMLRASFKHFGRYPGRLSTRWKISLFYAVPTSLLAVVAAALGWPHRGPPANWVFLALWWVLLIGAVLWMLSQNRRGEPARSPDEASAT